MPLPGHRPCWPWPSVNRMQPSCSWWPKLCTVPSQFQCNQKLSKPFASSILCLMRRLLGPTSRSVGGTNVEKQLLSRDRSSWPWALLSWSCAMGVTDLPEACKSKRIAPSPSAFEMCAKASLKCLLYNNYCYLSDFPTQLPGLHKVEYKWDYWVKRVA